VNGYENDGLACPAILAPASSGVVWEKQSAKEKIKTQKRKV